MPAAERYEKRVSLRPQDRVLSFRRPHGSMGAMSASATPPTIELREIEPLLFKLVAKVDGDEIVIREDLDGRESTDFSGGVYDEAFNVAVFQSDSATFVRIREASGNRYAEKPTTVFEKWHESTDGGRTWRRRSSPADGTLVTQFAEGWVKGWEG